MRIKDQKVLTGLLKNYKIDWMVPAGHFDNNKLPIVAVNNRAFEYESVELDENNQPISFKGAEEVMIKLTQD